MTREEFDRHYAASQGDTNGFSDDELGAINGAVFAEAEGLDPEDRRTEDIIDAAFSREFDKF